MKLEHTAKSVESLWSNRMKFTYPESNRCVDSVQTLYIDTESSSQNTYISRQKTEHIIRYNDLLPPLLRDGRIQELPAHYLSTFHPQRTFKIGQRIQIHIQFTDRVCSQNDVQQSTQTTCRNNSKKAQKRPQNRDRSRTPSAGVSGLNLPDLENKVRSKATSNSDDSISSMSTPETHHHHAQHRDKQSLTLKNLVTIDDDVIGDSESDVVEISAHVYNNNNHNNNINKKKTQQPQHVSLRVKHALIYELTLDDLKFAFFLRLFPQLYFTHDLVYCHNSYQHHYYQGFFTSDGNEYECVLSDEQLMLIYQRYLDCYFPSPSQLSMDYNIKNKDKYRDYLNRKIVLFFQIRPRYHKDDSYDNDDGDNETIDSQHQQIVWNNLVANHNLQKTCAKNDIEMKEQEQEVMHHNVNGVFAVESNGNQSMEHKFHSMYAYVNSSQESLVSDVIKAVNDTHDDAQATEDMSVIEIDDDGVIVEDDGVCAFCLRKFANERCREQSW
eukprot:CAMPEP_0202694730 /NCGR_PEP_ID=MMETSP1385-20130828/8517_1 /ASSEMBLY_ACC=CAM_ASM_000861 /TAXON_ID=933848 /ORGANISM="Elphidium margaritaceum" /LENGTH=496 /DNA_ID=CAMNT_0049350629 /DNA_START=147 /DNA_END=1634 /DNA_ORIENTATION=+